MKSGIYRITCLKTGKIYIGSATKIEYRCNQHFSELNKNIHNNKYLQNSWNKYGEEYFDWDIIEYCPIENLIEREQYYINYMKPQFNICQIAGSRLGIKASKETKKKMSKSLLGNKYNLGKIMPIDQKLKLSEYMRKCDHNIGKLMKGIPSPKRKLTNNEVKEIRKSNKTQVELAKEYNISLRAISEIINYKIYKEVK